jgi:hypothetical protein
MPQKLMNKKHVNRFLTVLSFAVVVCIGIFANSSQYQAMPEDSTENLPASIDSPAAKALTALPIKGRAPKTGYEREKFSDGWASTSTCDVRNEILQRDLESETLGPDECTVLTGTLYDPYTSKVIQFTRGATTSSKVQIDHVVAVSDAWQKGAQTLSYEERHAFYNDPLNLLAVDGPANQGKSDGDAATWLPSNKAFRCEYVARQVAVKKKYNLWVTRSEYEAINRTLQACPSQKLPTQD